MNAHMTTAMLDRISRRELPPPELAVALRHIGDCPTCARLAGKSIESKIDTMRERLAIADDSPHIDPETELAQYIDGTLASVEREIVETHLEDCAMCRAEVDDLMAAAKPPGRFWPVPLLAMAAAAAAILVTLPLIQRPAEVIPTHVSTSVPSIVTTETVDVAEPPAHRYANAEWDGLVREAMQSGKLPMPDLRSLFGAPDQLRGSSDPSSGGMTPAGVVVDTVQPRFSWLARESATYVVTIFDGDEAIAQSESLATAEWTPPSPLSRGRTYVWQVAATSGSSTTILPAPPAPPSMFLIASQRDHDELTAARTLHPNDHVLHAVLAARAGLRAEAKDALRQAKVDLDLP